MAETFPPCSPEALSEEILQVRVGPGANCSSAGSTIDVLFYGSAVVASVAVAISALVQAKSTQETDDEDKEPRKQSERED